MRCWGSNSYGQTGGGTQNRDNNLTLSGRAGSPLIQGEEATAIAAGRSHTCAILSGGAVRCWGRNSYGQTGGGTQNSGNDRTLSGRAGSPLIQGEEATAIAAGSYHTCAILSGGAVRCWGYNEYGQTGGGSPLIQGEEATAIAAGYRHTCAILSDNLGNTWMDCWGSGTWTKEIHHKATPLNPNLIRRLFL